MPVERIAVSVSQLAEMLEVDPKRLIGVEKSSTGFVIVLEPANNAYDETEWTFEVNTEG
jgi:hypothetical protein